MGEQRKEPNPSDEALNDKRLSVEGLRAHQMREDAGREARGRTAEPAEGVLVQVCETCGKEYYFDDEQPPSDLRCEKCGNQVFRSFFAEDAGDEAAEDFRRSTERDLAPDDAASDVTRSDVQDLNNP